MATTEAIDPVETMDERGTLGFLRQSVERLAFTQRGRFSFIAGLLLSIQSNVNGIRFDGVASASWSPVTDPTMIETAIQMSSGAATVFLGMVAGVVILSMLDLYEAQVGTTFDE